MFSILRFILLCALANLFCACLVTVHIYAPYAIAGSTQAFYTCLFREMATIVGPNVVFPLIVYENTYGCLSVVCLGVIQHLVTSYQFTGKVHSISNACPRRITVAIVQTCPIICIKYLCMYAFIYVYFRIPIRSSVTSYGGSGCARARKDASGTTCHCAAGFSEQTVTATTQSVTAMTRRPSTSY